ncbi:MAG TPA: M14 family metallopeptidase [Vicinamibacterales bacterium]
MSTIRPVACLRGLAVAALVGWLWPSAATAADFSKYHTYQELSAELKAIAAANPTLARVASIGRTREGRDIWAVEVANPAGTPVDQRPALLVAANFEGDHLIGSELALYLVDALVRGYAADAAIKQRLDNHVIYVVPRVNVDGAELMFAPIRSGRRTNATPYDADNDGRTDEDGPEDLNKDGFITLMRVKDPMGPYAISPEDPRLMKRADPTKGETGGWSLYWEGLDKDHDGFIAEDGPGGVDINRNFMHQYPYYEPDAGRYMAGEAETRAVLEYVLKHRNIAAILSFGESDNLIATPSRRGELAPANPINLIDFAGRTLAEARRVGLFQDVGGFGGRSGRGGGGMFVMDEGGFPGGGRGGASGQPTGRAAMPAQRPNTAIATLDFEYFRAISEKYRELTGLRAAGFTRAPAGAFFEYGYYQYGVPSFSTPGWGLPGGGRQAGMGTGAPGGAGAPAAIMAGAPAAFGQRGGGGRGAFGGAALDATAAEVPEGIDLRLLQWMDAEKIDGFVKWVPFRHPTLGDVEIGGFKPYVTTNPPAAKIAELGAAHAKFAVYLTSLFAKVKIARTEVTALGAGLFRIKADIENSGYLPTAVAQGVQARAVKPIMVQLGVPPESILTGNEKTTQIPTLAGSGSRQSFEWVIKGAPGSTVTLKAVSQKSGTDTATLTLR